jgi:hypothetical protein
MILCNKNIALEEIRNHERESLECYQFMLLDSFLRSLGRPKKLQWLKDNNYFENVPIYRGTTLDYFPEFPHEEVNFTGVITKALCFASNYSTRTIFNSKKLSDKAKFIAERFHITPKPKIPILITITCAEKYTKDLGALYNTIITDGLFSMNNIGEEDFVCRELNDTDFYYPYMVDREGFEPS